MTLRTVLESWTPDGEPPGPEESRTLAVDLDATGRARVDVPVPEVDHDGALYVELDYRDANGQVKTAGNIFELWPAAVVLDIADASQAPGRKWVQVRARRPDGAAAMGVVVEVKVHAHGPGRTGACPAASEAPTTGRSPPC